MIQKLTVTMYTCAHYFIHTFIIRSKVFRTMSNIMKFSNGGEVTSLQI